MTWREVVLVHAVAGIAYRGLIDHVQASWVKLGTSGAQQLLRAGVDDLGGTLTDENISRAAGAAHGQVLDVEDFRRIVEPIGRTLRERWTRYGDVAPRPRSAPGVLMAILQYFRLAEDCLIQPRRVSGTTPGTTPTRGPIRLTAALSDNDGCSVIASTTASTTIRCARSRSSLGYFRGAG